MFFKMFRQKKTLSTRALQGILELLPKDQIAFDKMKSKIQNIYESFGYIPLDTSVLEREEILLAKAGGDTEKEIYRIKKGDNDLALRFDLTIPFARYVCEHSRELNFPFRKYQIGRVYRGERPQRGRYRDFYQCDIDVVGDGELSLKYDAEIINIIYTTFSKLNIGPFVVKISNRKILNGFLESLNLQDRAPYVLRIIDKMAKIGADKVRELLQKEKLSVDQMNEILDFVSVAGTNLNVLAKLQSLNIENDTFKSGLDELVQVINCLEDFDVPSDYFKIDLTIVRGLDYYSGTVFETFLVEDTGLGSICSGGRYETLLSGFGDRKIPGVGAGLGLTRLFVPFKEKGLIKSEEKTLTRVLIVPLISDLKKPSILARGLRSRGINSEIFLDEVPMKKKLNYANKQAIPFVVIIGDDEVATDTFTVKNMNTGEQQRVALDSLYRILSAN